MPDSRPVALVTGGSRGIGRAITERLVQDGFDVAFTSRSADPAGISHEVPLMDGADVCEIPYEAADRAGASRLVGEATAWKGRLDVVVANAALPHRAPYGAIDPNEFDRVFGVNARATFFLMTAAADVLGTGGRIIAISSSQTLHPTAEFALYSGSKAAVEAFVCSLAQEIGHRGITINAIICGAVADGFLKDAPAEVTAPLAANAALGRLGSPQEIAAAVSFLASRDASFVTGSRLVVDGGAQRF